MSTGNQKVSQLVELTPSEIAINDLLYIVDVSAAESKNMTISDLSAYFNASGSLYVIHAINSDTASFILGGNVFGSVLSSSFSNFCLSSLSASWASRSLSSSFSTTSSYSLNTNFTNSIVSASWASQSLSSSLALVSDISLFLSYNGNSNGTCSYAVNTQNTVHSINSDTASYFNNQILNVQSSSYAFFATSASVSLNANTASYATQANSVLGVMLPFGMFTAYTQSLSSSIIDTINVNPSLGVSQSTLIQSIGNSILYFTASVPTNYTLSLFLLNRINGQTTILDSTTVGFNTSTIPSNWDTLESGSMNVPFNLIGQSYLIGKYLVEVTSSSPKLTIDQNRSSRFLFSSTSDVFTSNIDEPIQFIVTPTSSVLFTFYSNTGGPFIDHLPGLLQTGSQNIISMSVNNQGVTDIRYTWKCNNLTSLTCSNNPSLQALSYSFSPPLKSLLCNSCSISYINDLSNTSMSYFNCSYNQLSNLPTLPISLSYFDFSYNPISNLILPFGYLNLNVLYAQSSSLSIVSYLPDSLMTASFSSCPLIFIPSPLPVSMSYLDISDTFISSIPTVPTSMSFLNLESASFTMSDLENVTGQLVSNGILSGSLNLQSYGTPGTYSPTLLTNVSLLQTNDWNIIHD